MTPLSPELVAATERLRIGHPFDSGDAGGAADPPEASRRSREPRRARPRRRRQDPDRRRAARPARTMPMAPTTGPPSSPASPTPARLCRDEVFGPVLAVLPFDDEADVIRQSNDNSYGLACGIYTRDFPQGLAHRARHRHRHGLDQHLQAVLDLDAVRRHQGLRSRPRKGPRRHPCLDGAEVDLLRLEPSASPLG